MSQLPSPSTSRAGSTAFGRLMSPQFHKLLTLLTVAGLCFYFSLPPSHTRLRLKFPKVPARLGPVKVPFVRSELPRAVEGRGLTLTEYLDARFPNVPPGAEAMTTMPDGSQLGPHVWITMADEKWAASGAFGLHKFVEQLNDERELKYGKLARRTELVTLCLDPKCVAICKGLNMYCYGGHTFTRPPMIIVSTWPKLATMIEVLKTRDLFFVDSDVLFREDPYPLMEPLMKTHDLVAQENESFDHFNTGWMWLRRGQAVSDAWQKVLDMDLVTKSRDQNRFNEVLGTNLFRGQGKGLVREYTAVNGLKVHVLDPELFYSWHFERDVSRWARHDSVSMHITCGDDEPMKVYMLKSLGYWPDTNNYFSRPHNLVSIDALGGTQQEVAQMVKVAIVVAYYTQRAVQPPTHAVFTDLLEFSDNSTSSPMSPLPIYSSFPWAHIARDFKGKVPTVEPLYAENAAKFLLGGSVLGRGQTRLNLKENWSKGIKGASVAYDLLNPVAVDVRQFGSLGELLEAVVAFNDKSHVRLEGFNLATLPSSDSSLKIEHIRAKPKHRETKPPPPAPIELWKDWAVPEPAARIKPCYNLSRPAGCETICRFRGGRRVDVRGEWPTLESIIHNQGPAVKHWWEL